MMGRINMAMHIFFFFFLHYTVFTPTFRARTYHVFTLLTGIFLLTLSSSLSPILLLLLSHPRLTLSDWLFRGHGRDLGRSQRNTFPVCSCRISFGVWCCYTEGESDLIFSLLRFTARLSIVPTYE